MIDFSVNGLSVFPTSVWYHKQDDAKSEGHPYQIKISNDPDLVAFLEKTFQIDFEKADSVKSLMDASENHHSLINLIIKYLVKTQNYERVPIDWVFNGIKEVGFHEKEVVILGLASKFDPNYGD